MIYRIIFISIGIAILFSCQKSVQTIENQFPVIRLTDDPGQLNPMLSTSKASAQIEAKIFQPLAEIDPYVMTLQPVLLEKLPESSIINNGPHQGKKLLKMDLKAAAKWSDGKNVSAEDVLFTLKIIFNESIPLQSYRSQLDFIEDVVLFPDQPRHIEFIIDPEYDNGEIYAVSYHIYPKHIYDPQNLMAGFSFSDLKLNKFPEAEKKTLEAYADVFQSGKYAREIVTGSGPYQIANWTTGYECTLEKKNNWWGDAFNSSSLFAAKPAQLIYRVIPDEQAAIQAMISNQLDVLPKISADQFAKLKETQSDKLNFFTPSILQYFYIALNNESPYFSDVKVRKALAHLVDQNKLIKLTLNGMAEPLTCPFNPRTEFYDTALKPYEYDESLATNYLNSAGWNDSDDDGVLDKVVNGKKTPFKIRFFVTSKPLGQQIGVVLKEHFDQVGIDLEIVPQAFSETKKAMSLGQFEMAAMAARQSTLVSNLKPTWHSEGMESGGQNFSNFSNTEVDQVIDSINYTTNTDIEKKLHRKFHKLIYENVPVLFLFMPAERIIVNKKWKIKTSDIRPGYFENDFVLEK